MDILLMIGGVFSLNVNIDELKSIEEALGMNDSESEKIVMEENY